MPFADCATMSPWVDFDLAIARSRAAARALYRQIYGLDPQDYQTNILIVTGVAWFKSEGSIRMAEGLGFPWRLAAVVSRAAARAGATLLYDTVARNRLRWFGTARNLLPARSDVRRPVHRMKAAARPDPRRLRHVRRAARAAARRRGAPDADRRGALAAAGRGVLRRAAGAAPMLVPAAFDRDGDVDAQLGALAPDIVVDASGPFQAYGDPYRAGARRASRAASTISISPTARIS